MLYTIYTAVQGSFAEISPEGRRPEGDISAKLPRTAVYIVYSPNNHDICDIFHEYIFLLCNFSSHFEVGVQYTPTFLSMRSCNLWSPHALRLFLLVLLCVANWAFE